MKIRKRTWTNTDGRTAFAWVVDFRANGIRHTRTLRNAKTRKEAEKEALAVVSAAQKKSGPRRKSQPLPLEETLANDRQRAGVSPYTERMEKGIAKHLCRVLGDSFDLRRLSGAAVESYKRVRQSEKSAKGTKVATRTINMELQLLKAAVNRLVETGDLEEAPCSVRLLPSSPKRRRYLSREEMLLLLAECRKTPGLYEVIAFMANTGLRRNECFDLAWKDVDMEKALATIHTKKRGRSLEVHCDPIPLNPVCMDILRARAAAKPRHKATDLIFGITPAERSDTGRKVEKRGTLGGIEFHGDWKLGTRLKGAAKAAGIDWWQELRVTDLRHAFCNLLLETGGDIRDVAAMVRHRSIATTMNNYLHPRMQTMRSSVEALSLAAPEELETTG